MQTIMASDNTQLSTRHIPQPRASANCFCDSTEPSDKDTNTLDNDHYGSQRPIVNGATVSILVHAKYGVASFLTANVSAQRLHFSLATSPLHFLSSEAVPRPRIFSTRRTSVSTL